MIHASIYKCMKRIIYSIFIQIPNDDLDWQPPYQGETESKNEKANRVFLENHSWLTAMQESYAHKIGAEYRQYIRDDQYLEFEKVYKEKYPDVTVWNIVNFYKIHLMYELAKEFDEVLYLDIDVVPISNENFFDEHDLTRGIAIFQNDPGVNTSLSNIKSNTRWREGKEESHLSNRSPAAKYWNSFALLLNEGEDPKNYVFNTGIVGCTKKYLDQLDYFSEHDYWIETMSELRYEENSMYPMWIQEIFGWDNETLWSVKAKINGNSFVWLQPPWHHFMDRDCFIPQDTKFIHVINKEFEWVRNWCDKNNIHPISSAE